MKLISTLIPAIILLAVLLVTSSAHFIWRRYNRNKKKRSPFTDNFLRSPGQSLLEQLNVINGEISLNFLYVVTIPILFYATHISQSYFGGTDETQSRILATLITGILFSAFFIFKLVKMLNLKKIIQLGYEGEVETGQRLNEMMLEGIHVYHDFPANGFNIDHIVVGVHGVFAVETKARSKPTTNDRTADARVTYDGKSLNFPSWTDTKTIDQARRQAAWLSKWCSSAVGEKVSVQPIVSLPGWFVKRTTPTDGMFVINPKAFQSIIKPRTGHTLDESMIKRIVHQFDQKCRDVAPKEEEIKTLNKI